MILIHEEINLVIKQANRYIDYINKKGTYGEFAHDFLRIANKSKIKQNFTYLQQWLNNNVQTQPEDMLQMILNFEGLIKAIADQTDNLDNEMYNNAKQYWNEAQQNLKDRDLYSYGK
tara:strand:+ start:1380 stop:1730 length:351 start_codon:yes stop_codon:yes gene_type:complete